MPVFLVCEGQHGSLDERVLNALVVQPSAPTVQTAPAGSDTSLGSVCQYIERPKPQSAPPAPPDVAVAVADRNYRPRAEADATWNNAARRRFVWRRHEIENYLLEPRVVLELFDNFRAAVPPPWAAGLPASEAAVGLFLQTRAAPLVENHAAEVLRAELVRALSPHGLRFGVRAPAPPQGAFAPGRAEWLPVLTAEATRILNGCATAGTLVAYQPNEIAARYQVLLAQFQNPPFLAAGDYLFDLGGHELLQSLAFELRRLGGPPALTEQYLGTELLAALGRVYQPNTLFQPDDFAALGTILAQY